MNKVLRAIGMTAVGAIIFILSACAGTPETISHEESWSRFVGHWTNPENTDRDIRPIPPELVYEAEFTAKFIIAPNLERTALFKLQPRRSWVDAEGYVYCEAHIQYLEGWRMPRLEAAELLRVDKQGRTLEMNLIWGVPAEGTYSKHAYQNLQRIDPQFGEKLGSMTSYWICHRA